MRVRLALTASIAVVLCVACGGGHDSGGGYNPGNDPPPPTHTVGGTVTGLRGSGLALQNGNTHLPVTSDSVFTFPDMLAEGTSYSVSVQTQPSHPTQACTVSDGSGTVGTANITNVTVTCITPEA